MSWIAALLGGGLGGAAAFVAGPEGAIIAGAAVAGAWLIGRAAATAGGPSMAAASDGQTAQNRAAAMARLSAELDEAKSAAAIETAAQSAMEQGCPSGTVTLWLVSEAGKWTRPDGAALERSPSQAMIGRLAERPGIIVMEHVAEGTASVSELAFLSEGEYAAPLVRGGATLGILWARGGGQPAREILAAMQPRVSEALVHSRMVRRIERHSKVAADVEVAAAVQQALIPDGSPRWIGPVALAATYVPASQCGGDWWAAHAIDGDSVLIVVADVTGHGIGAARITAAASGALEASVRLQNGRPQLPDVMRALDVAVLRVGAGHYHMTCFAAIIHSDRRVDFTGAAHVAPYVCRQSGDGGRVQIDALVARGNPLGSGTDQKFSVTRQQLQKNDLLLFYSDGLTDATNPGFERWGDRRMQRLLRQVAAPDMEIGHVRDTIEQTIGDFIAGTPQEDDITFTAVRLR